MLEAEPRICRAMWQDHGEPHPQVSWVQTRANNQLHYEVAEVRAASACPLLANTGIGRVMSASDPSGHCPLSRSRTKILFGAASLAFNDALWPAMFLPQSNLSARLK